MRPRTLRFSWMIVEPPIGDAGRRSCEICGKRRLTYWCLVKAFNSRKLTPVFQNTIAVCAECTGRSNDNFYFNGGKR